jgi:pimeloyl-ACP methyl ester carboxylesterase
MILQYAKVFGRNMAYRIYGEGPVDVVLMTGLGSCIGEYEQLAQYLSKRHTVLCYERFGCGSSEETERERTPVNIAAECAELLKWVAHQEKIILVAHSQGGLYANQYVRLYPDQVGKMLLLDPLSPEDDLFQRKLTKEEYRKSGVDKTAGLRINLWLLRFGMGGLVKRMMSSAPPFYYYKDFTQDETDYILECLTRKKVYHTALKEYEMSHARENLECLRTKGDFPDIPLYLITHSSKIAVEEIMTFGNADRETAEKVETLWQELMKRYLGLSGQSSYLCAENSSHAIHLTDMELIGKIV